MPVKVRIPTPLRTITNGVDIAEISGANIAEVLNALSAKFDGMDKRLFKQPGELNRFVNIYLNDEDIRFLDNLNTPIKDGDDVSIVPAIAGG
jgi:sulfur-carrier protein